MYIGPNIPTNGLKAFFDVSNPKCVDASQTIDSNTRLINLVSDSNIQMQSQDTTSATLGNMSFVEDNGSYVYNQNAIAGTGEPGWKGINNPTRVNDYSFVCWYKYNYGSSYQRAENIYGGGFGSRTSFYLSPSGTSASHGILRYSDVGGTNSYGVQANYGGSDGEWHMFAATDTGPDVGVQTSKFYLDGVWKATAASNSSHDNNDGTDTMVWGSWSGTYGNFNGRTNCFMYYERVLTDDEIYNIYNGMKRRFI